MGVIRVLIADDHPVLRAGLRTLIDAQRDMQVVGEVDNADEVVWKTQAVRPHVVTLDISMPGTPVHRVLQALAVARHRPRVLVVSMHDDPLYAETLLAAGARGYVTKSAGTEELLKAIRRVHAGEIRYRDETSTIPVTSERPTSSRPPTHRHALSKRELQVLRLSASGYTYQEIAEQLGIGINSVGTYRSRAAKKLGVSSRAELIHFAVRAGLVEDPEKRD